MIVEMNPLPRLLADFARPRAIIKADYEDFVVDEIPLYPADGTGTHTYFLLEKAGLSTHQAIHDVAQRLGVRRHDIGYAGLKDSRAITRQWMSVEHVPPERLAGLEMPRLRVLRVTRHGNKIRMGHLKGNRFTIRVRGEVEARLADLREALTTLARRGVPNYFGEQRFGYRGDSWRIGRAILLGEREEATDLMLGRATDADHGDVRKARKCYDKGDYEQALMHWPRIFQTERRMLAAILRSGGKKQRALYAADKSAKTFMVSAYQSYLFNRVVAERLPTGLDRLQLGDLAWLHASGAVFRVEDLEREQARADVFEISPTGPLFGYRCTEPGGWPQELEQKIMESEGLRRDTFRAGPQREKGGRRPLRFPIDGGNIHLGADDRGTYVELQFILPRGCYATTVLRELFDLSGDTEGAESDEPGETCA